MDNIKIHGWIPYKLTNLESGLLCHWLDTGGTPFIEPFFDETIVKCKSGYTKVHTFQQVSSLEMMLEWAQSLGDVIPEAFIFHISRCGSTLVSQLLASSSKNVSLAEVPFFDDILRLPYKHTDFSEAEINSLLKAAVKFYTYKFSDNGYPGNGEPERLFIKADSWHIFFYEQLRRLYPDVPFILMYRRPDEVFMSHRKQAGMQAVPGLIEPELFGFKRDEIGHNLDIYLANVLHSYLNKYLEIAGNDKRCMLLNYNEGPMQMINKISAFANIVFSQKELEDMKERSQYHSKKPHVLFSEEKTNEMPNVLAPAMEAYQLLEGKRIATV